MWSLLVLSALLVWAISADTILPCNIPKLSIAELGRNRSLPEYPFIFVDTETRQQELAEISAREYLIDNHGDIEVTLSSSNTFSHGKVVSTLEEYIRANVDTSSRFANETFYLFGNNYHGIWSELADLYRNPPCYGCDEAGMKTIGIGGEASGVSFHFHGPGFSESIIGTKRWFLFPPSVSSIVSQFSPNMTVAQWVDRIYPRIMALKANPAATADRADPTPTPSQHAADTVFSSEYDLYGTTTTPVSQTSLNDSSLAALARTLQECTIVPGEILYFPPMWMHATLNLDVYNVFMSLFIDPQLIK